MRKRDIILILAAVLAAAVLLITQFAGDSLATGAWGLSFRQENAPPLGPASAQELARYNAVYLGDTNEKVIYLTFDAGYENGCIPGSSAVASRTPRCRSFRLSPIRCRICDPHNTLQSRSPCGRSSAVLRTERGHCLVVLRVLHRPICRK